MSFKCICPNCKQELECDDSLAETYSICPICNEKFKIYNPNAVIPKEKTFVQRGDLFLDKCGGHLERFFKSIFKYFIEIILAIFKYFKEIVLISIFLYSLVYFVSYQTIIISHKHPTVFQEIGHLISVLIGAVCLIGLKIKKSS